MLICIASAQVLAGMLLESRHSTVTDCSGAVALVSMEF